MIKYSLISTFTLKTMNNIQYSFKGVQALRGLAALSVMLFHFRWNLNQVQPPLGDQLFGWGAIGVDLFFLISGFVITLSASRTPGGIRGAMSFLKKRAIRILPAYYFWLLITFLLCGAMSIFHYADKKENLISALLFMPIYPDHAPFFVDDSGNYGIRWTLNYELYFYLILGAMITFKARWLWVGLYFLSTLVLLPIILTGSLTLNVSGYVTQSAVLGLIINPMIYLFLVGVLIGLILPYLSNLSSKVMTFFAGFAFIICVYFFSRGEFTGHGLYSSGWILALLMLFVILSENTIGKFIPRSLIRLGDISYSLYLVHTLVNNGLVGRFQKLGLQPGWAMFALSILISLTLAVISWRCIELPFQKQKNHSTKVSMDSLT